MLKAKNVNNFHVSNGRAISLLVVLYSVPSSHLIITGMGFNGNLKWEEKQEYKIESLGCRTYVVFIEFMMKVLSVRADVDVKRKSNPLSAPPEIRNL